MAQQNVGTRISKQQACCGSIGPPYLTRPIRSPERMLTNKTKKCFASPQVLNNEIAKG